ncbi:MAG: hypothetical protein WA715_05705 [Candidatus Acidiferrum sp.]
MKSGDIYVHCSSVEEGMLGRQTARLTHTGDIKSWGITPDAKLLALIREPVETRAVLELHDLNSGRAKKSESIDKRSSVEPTCGTVVLRSYWEDDQASGYKFRDLATGEMIPVPSQTSDLRCSSDRRYTLRLANDGELYLDMPEPSALLKGIREFNISPGGSYIAYADGENVCAGTRDEVRSAKASCLGMTWIAGPMIVSDSGSVLFTEQTSEACTFEILGKKLSDPCPAIFSWSPGDQNDQLLSFNDSDPHIINADIGHKIIRLNKGLVSGTKLK